jgi:sugar/nucleoside kinase (ribokinase family)
MNHSVQLLGVSNAIVDVLTHVEDDFVGRIGAERGSMTLIDAERAAQIYGMMGPSTENSGGSVANTVAAFANLGGNAAYIGRVADDQLGAIFAHDMRSLGVDLRLPPETRSAPTARCHVLISPDGERTLQTFLGACTEIAVTDIDAETVGSPEIMLLEGYIWDTPEGPAAMEKAVALAKANGGKVAISLSDADCVRRHLDTFRALVDGDADIIIANEGEIGALFGTSDFEAIVEQAAEIDALFVLTRSERGSVIVRGSERAVQPADPVARVVDSTGAGDAFAAGFLYALVSGQSLADAARLGTRCATIVIQQVGARLEKHALDDAAA